MDSNKNDIFESIKKMEVNCTNTNAIDNIRLKRIELNKIDKNLLDKNKVLQFEIENLKEIPDGQFNIKVDSTIFNCFFKFKNKCFLYVFLRAWKGKNDPVISFARWSWYPIVDGITLAINDPTFNEHDDLNVGWYLGNNKKDYIEYLSKIVKKIAAIYKIPENHIIYYGSSAGGTAAIHASNKTFNSISLSINPQILGEYHGHLIEEFQTSTGINIFEMGDRTNTTLQIIQKKSKHILIVNAGCDVDYKQILALANRIKIKLKYGVNKKDNLIIWIYEAPGASGRSAHHSFENKTMFFAIDSLIRSVADNKEINESLYTLFSEFWYERYSIQSDEKTKFINYVLENSSKPGYTEIKKCSPTKDNPQIEYIIGCAYLEGKGIKKNRNKAIELIKSAANNYNIDALNKLYEMTSENPKMNTKEIFDIYLKLTLLGYSCASGGLSRFYRNGIIVDKNLDKAIDLIRPLSNQNILSKNELSDMLLERGNEDDIIEMKKITLNCISIGNERAMGRLGRMYRDGKGVDKNNILAIEWMRKAADKNPIWTNELTDILLKSSESKYHTEAFERCSVISQTNAGAMGRLGRMYRDGKGVDKNNILAIEWMRKAADKNPIWTNELKTIIQ